MAVTHPAQTYTSPDGKHGYIAIHRCASSSIGQWLKYDSGLGWDRGVGFDPDVIEEVLVVTRDPDERRASALRLAEKWGKPMPEDDDHLAPQELFYEPYLHLPLTFIDISEVDSYFIEKGWGAPPNINSSVSA